MEARGLSVVQPLLAYTDHDAEHIKDIEVLPPSANPSTRSRSGWKVMVALAAASAVALARYVAASKH